MRYLQQKPSGITLTRKSCLLVPATNPAHALTWAGFVAGTNKQDFRVKVMPEGFCCKYRIRKTTEYYCMGRVEPAEKFITGPDYSFFLPFHLLLNRAAIRIRVHRGNGVECCPYLIKTQSSPQHCPDTAGKIPVGPYSCLLYTSPSPRDRQKTRM